MKFQNSSIHGFKVMLCIKKRDERTDGRTNNPEAICPSNFFEVGGIKRAADISPCPTTALTSNKYHNFVNKLIKFQENIANSFQVTERTQIYYRNH